MMPSHNMWRCALLAALVFVLAGLACDPGHTVTWENRTPYRLVVFDEDDVVVSHLEPFETLTVPQKKFLWEGKIAAKTPDGRVVFQVDLTWEELKAQDWRIVITEDMLSPPPTESR